MLIRFLHTMFKLKIFSNVRKVINLFKMAAKRNRVKPRNVRRCFKYTMVHKSWNAYYEVGIVGMLQLQNKVDI